MSILDMKVDANPDHDIHIEDPENTGTALCNRPKPKNCTFIHYKVYDRVDRDYCPVCIGKWFILSPLRVFPEAWKL